MLPIQMRRRRQGDEKLAAVRARSAVGHTQHAFAVMHQRSDDLVLEFAAVDRRAAGTGAGGVAALQHEAGNDAVEDDVVVFVRGR